MAQPLLDFLEGRQRAALPFFRKGVNLGLGANDIIVMVSERFGGIRRQVALDIIAALRGGIDAERAARLVGETVPIPHELHRVSPAQLTTNYQYVVGAFDESGEPVGYLTVSSDVPLAAVQIRAQGELLFKTQRQLYIEENAGPVAAVSILEANRL